MRQSDPITMTARLDPSHGLHSHTPPSPQDVNGRLDELM